jgi:D-inositol-3-phosphate glycosyltransferase
MKRIALISEHASPLAPPGGIDSGGQNIYVAQLAKHLALAGYDVDIFTRRDKEWQPEVAEWIPRVRLIHVPAGPARYVRKEDLFPLMNEFASWVRTFCERESPSYDVVHANFWMSGIVARHLQDTLGIPFVITFHALGRVRRLHQPDSDEFPDERLTIEDELVQEADHIIAECPQDKEDLMHLYNAHPARVAIIPCGFDAGEFWPMGKLLARAMLGLPRDVPLVLQLGRLVPRKGIDNVIRGLACLKRDHGIRAILAIVGGNTDKPDALQTPEIARLSAIARDEGIRDQVRFIGRRGRDVLRFYYSAADIFATTPWYEPFGMTPLEAMACGTPVIASSVGGLKFSVRDGQTGFLVPPKNPKLLGDRLAYYFRHPVMASSLRNEAMDYVNRYFTWPKVADAVSTLYDRVLARRKTRLPDAAEAAWIWDRRSQPRATAEKNT